VPICSVSPTYNARRFEARFRSLRRSVLTNVPLFEPRSATHLINRTVLLFECFPYICPEPGLAK
jgi:hypothetical protein